MNAVLQIVASNVAVAAVLAVVAVVAGRTVRSAPLVHFLWLLVLVKLITPPLVYLPVVETTQQLAPSGNGDVPLAGPGDGGQNYRDIRLQFVPSGVERPVALNVSAELQSEDSYAAEGNVDIALQESIPVSFDLLGAGHDADMDLRAALPEDEAAQPASGAPEGGRNQLVLGVSLVWFAGSIAWLSLVAIRTRRFQRLVRQTRSADAALVAQADAFARRIGVRRLPELRVTTAQVTPFLWSMFGRPTIVLPKTLCERLNERQLLTLVSHELAHYRRGDHLVRWLEVAVLAVYWWCPLAWWARRELVRAEEQCCDAWVVWLFHGAERDYAEALLYSLEFLSEATMALPSVASGLSPVHVFERRLKMILQGSTSHALSRRAKVLLAIVALAVLPLAAYAEDEPAEKPRVEIEFANDAPAEPSANDGNVEIEFVLQDVAEPSTPTDAEVDVELTFDANADAELVLEPVAAPNDAVPVKVKKTRRADVPSADEPAEPKKPKPKVSADLTFSGKAPKGQSVEDRLERLEQAVASLVGEMKRPVGPYAKKPMQLELNNKVYTYTKLAKAEDPLVHLKKARVDLEHQRIELQAQLQDLERKLEATKKDIEKLELQATQSGQPKSEPARR